MRRIALIASLLLAAPAFAQAPPTGTAPPTTNAPPLAGASAMPGTPPGAAPATDGLPSTPARGRHARKTMPQRFAEANTTHDGHLTLDQARAEHMGAVVRDFSAIDKDGNGYVTMAQIRDYRRAHRGQHRASQN